MKYEKILYVEMRLISLGEFVVSNHWMFNMGVVVLFISVLAYVVSVDARMIELGAKKRLQRIRILQKYTSKQPVAEKVYSRSVQ